MISVDGKFRLRDLEIFRFLKDNIVLAYVINEDTRKPYTEEDKKLDPLCFLDEEDLNEIVNVFKVYFLSDEPLKRDESVMLREFFGELVYNSSFTNYITQEYIDEKLYEYADDICNTETYQRILEVVGSSNRIRDINTESWLHLSQD
ncbi:terpene synthase [Sporosarcina sp. P18a]|uniref:terpene synthase n=1 Tax=Sporosarcina sp. P18a TaxID=2048259 RepID=UPI000C1688BD|nr:terpene synthase [Sporosarcina sp. P18a]PIC80188.1 terpene synthase [Sporosarcina sp. P18a]